MKLVNVVSNAVKADTVTTQPKHVKTVNKDVNCAKAKIPVTSAKMDSSTKELLA